MQYLKQFIITGFLFISSHSFVNAQPPQGEGPGPQVTETRSDNEVIAAMQTEWMKKKLKLNTSQLKEAETINDRYVKKILEAKKTAGPDADKRKNEAANEREEAFKKILTGKQFSKFQKNKSILDNGFDYSGNNFAAPPPPPGGM